MIFNNNNGIRNTIFIIVTLICGFFLSFNVDTSLWKIFYDQKSEVVITHYYNKPINLTHNHLIDVSNHKGEYLEVNVIGEITSFKYISIKYDENQGTFVDDKVLYEKEKISNEDFYIHCYLPDGMPFEKLTWLDSQGKAYEHLLQEDGLGEKKWHYKLNTK